MRALAWKSGRTSRQWSSEVMAMASAMLAVMASTLPCVIITPLGRPVEPLV